MAAIQVGNHLMNGWMIETIEYEPGKAFATIHTSSGQEIVVPGDHVDKIARSWQREVWPLTSGNPSLKDISTSIMSLIPISEMVPIEEVKNVLRSILAPGSYTE